MRTHLLSRVRDAGAYAARLGVSRVRRRPLIVTADLYPTHRCNLRCVYCNSPYLNTPELPTATWLQVIDELAALGCRRVLMHGGEPLLRPDIGDLIARVRDGGMACVLASNGLLVPKRLDALRGVNTLVLSLDAPGPANDAVRGRGVFEAVRAAIAAARQAGMPVKVNAVLSAVTAPYLDDLLAFIEAHDLYVTLNVVRSGAPDLWRDARSVKADDEEIARLFSRIAAIASRTPRVLFTPNTYRYAARWADYSRDRFEADEIAADDPRVRSGPACRAGRDYLSIGPDGTVYPCALTFNRLPGGNVVSDGVEGAWRRLHNHSCVACYTPCLVQKNYLFSLKPYVVGQFVWRHLRRYA